MITYYQLVNLLKNSIKNNIIDVVILFFYSSKYLLSKYSLGLSKNAIKIIKPTIGINKKKNNFILQLASCNRLTNKDTVGNTFTAINRASNILIIK